MNEFYLGDGLFASFNGELIDLRAPRDGGDDHVYLDREMLDRLVQYMKEQK